MVLIELARIARAKISEPRPLLRVTTAIFIEGLATAKKAYEISKSLDFGWDFEISELISGFRERFRDFVLDFKISGKISRFRVISVRFRGRFQDFG